MKSNDILWKSVLEDVFDDFLRFIFVNAELIFDIEKGFHFVDTELGQILDKEPGALFQEEDIQASKSVDKLVKVFTREGGEKFLLVHVEVQGYRDKNFEERMFTYFYRIKDKFPKKPVTAIAILTDANKKYRPAVYRYDLLGASVNYQFNTYKIIDQDEETLLANDNPFAIVILTVLLALKRQKLSAEELYEQKLALAENLFSRNLPEGKTRALFRFLKYYVRLKKKGDSKSFDNNIHTIIKKKKIMGIEEYLIEQAGKEGEKRGERRKIREIVKRLVNNTDLSIDQIASLVKVPETFVSRMKKTKAA